MVVHKIIEKIKEERIRKGYSQEYVAHYLGIYQSTYSKIEQENQKLLAEDLCKLARLYGFSVDDLLND